VRHHLLGQPNAGYAEWAGPLVTPRAVINAVLEDRIDVGPLDSYVHDLLRRHEPETAAKLRIVDSTAMTPIPLLVASSAADRDAVMRLRTVLLSCHAAPELAATLDTLLLRCFVAVDAAEYAMLVAWASEADEGGVPRPET
jgi:ABC-type phosphate/phosphonate transport system substrate-binding protein